MKKHKETIIECINSAVIRVNATLIPMDADYRYLDSWHIGRLK